MKSVVVLSGGMDSAVLLAKAIAEKDTVVAISFDYGQRHRKELHAAAQLANFYCIPQRTANLQGIREFIGGSSQTSDDIEVPEGHYADENMKKTVVPNRNAIMLSVAIGWAIHLKFDRVLYGAHGGDHAIYPDCRTEFVMAMNQVAGLADWHKVNVEAPFTGMSKAQICELGWKLEVPFRLTWSCYKGGEKHCGKCGTCVERLEAFTKTSITDPTSYE